MRTIDLEFTLGGKPARVWVELRDEQQNPIAGIRLACGNYRVTGINKAKEWLGDSYHPLIAHILREVDLGDLPPNTEPQNVYTP